MDQTLRPARRQRRTISRSIRLLRGFLREQVDPDTFYEMLSQDAVGFLAENVRLEGSLAVDVGGGAGYLTNALRRAGASCFLCDLDVAELSWRGKPLDGSLLGDAQHLPFSTGSIDIAVASNMLEHVPEPFEVIDEMARTLRPEGYLWLSFTNWYSPWGGHETSPWHYLGGDRARRRYEARAGHPPKNRFGESLFAVHIAPVLRHLKNQALLELVNVRPRYLPDFSRAVVRVPLLREVVTWNLEVLARRRHDGA
ncbi:MAG: methyltransferase domain-containing protein [Acidimicrobiales bacterium]